MLVKDWMNKDIIFVEVDSSMMEAKKWMDVHRVRTLPVLKAGKLVGVVTDRDIQRAAPSPATSLSKHELTYLQDRVLVKEIMTRDPATLSPDDTVEQAAMLFWEKKISGAPVVDERNKLVGTITQDEIFRVLISLTGAWHRGIQFGLLLDDKPGAIKAVEDIIREYGGRIISILSTMENAPWRSRYVTIRIRPIDKNLVSPLVEEIRKIASVLYVLDQRNGTRLSMETGRGAPVEEVGAVP